jgi:hypothetical protein
VFAVTRELTHCVVVTRMSFAVTAGPLWRSLMFYEQIDEPPPWYLRVLLPRPIRAEGEKSAVGDEALCLYEGGHLVKRVTRIDPGHRVEFVVVEQRLAVGAAIQLSGGSYILREIGGGRTEISVTTRYTGGRRPRWAWRKIEAAFCHLFHRHLLSSIGRKAGKPVSTAAPSEHRSSVSG